MILDIIDIMSFIDFDNDTSSDDEYDTYNDNKRPYNLCKNGREYIYINAYHDMSVPSYEFEKVYGKYLDILRNKCKDIYISNGITTYTFLFHRTYTYSDSKWKPKYQYIYNDMELDKIAKKIRNKIEVHADSIPWNCGCKEKDKIWYSESIYGRTSGIIKEYFIFDKEEPDDNPDAYIKISNQYQLDQLSNQDQLDQDQ